ncbi:hypothetical protein H8K33_11535 [Undibacterium amnicola]|uniref:DUF4124 domain-containing protein n=1 Tax=Undibacterium amnicola TaxID=1834038 RepID=A0ABR6XRN7_9BURK|nr:hypothetical protein [Undibacterium amnicola]MBC3832145.1 hypothetical protein [Undibacterium amnicola]
MEKIILSIMSLLSIVVMGSARADIFRCTTAQGKVVTSDRPIPECISRGMKVYTDAGRFKKNIAPPLSTEEKQKIADEQERKQREQLAEEERKREERYLLAHYQSEADVQAARKRAVDVLLDKKRLANEQLENFNQLFLDLQKELSQSKRTTQEFESIQRRANDLSSNVTNTRKAMAFYDQEIIRMNREYDDTLKRFRETVGRSRR